MNQKKNIRDLFQEFHQEFENQALEIGFDEFALEFCKRLTLLIRCIPLSKDSEREYILEIKDRVFALAKAIREDKIKEENGIDVARELSEKRKEFIGTISRFRYRDKKAIEIRNQYETKIPLGQKSLEKEKRVASVSGMNGGKNLQKGRPGYHHQIGATAVVPRWARPDTEELMVGRNLAREGWGAGQRDIVETEADFYLEQLKYLEDGAEKFGINNDGWGEIVDAIVNLEENREKYLKTSFSASLSGFTQDREEASTAKKQLKRNFYAVKKLLVRYSGILEVFKEKIAVMHPVLGGQGYDQKQPSQAYSGRFDSVRSANPQTSEDMFGSYAQGREAPGPRPSIRG